VNINFTTIITSPLVQKPLIPPALGIGIAAASAAFGLYKNYARNQQVSQEKDLKNRWIFDVALPALGAAAIVLSGQSFLVSGVVYALLVLEPKLLAYKDSRATQLGIQKLFQDNGNTTLSHGQVRRGLSQLSMHQPKNKSQFNNHEPDKIFSKWLSSKQSIDDDDLIAMLDLALPHNVNLPDLKLILRFFATHLEHLVSYDSQFPSTLLNTATIMDDNDIVRDDLTTSLANHSLRSLHNNKEGAKLDDFILFSLIRILQNLKSSFLSRPHPRSPVLGYRQDLIGHIRSIVKTIRSPQDAILFAAVCTRDRHHLGKLREELYQLAHRPR